MTPYISLFPELPPAAGPVPPLRVARRIAHHVYGLAWDTNDTNSPPELPSGNNSAGDRWAARALAVARGAERWGAHSVARVLRWAAIPESWDRHGPDAVSIRMERAAERWLRRVECHYYPHGRGDG